MGGKEAENEEREKGGREERERRCRLGVRSLLRVGPLFCSKSMGKKTKLAPEKEEMVENELVKVKKRREGEERGREREREREEGGERRDLLSV